MRKSCESAVKIYTNTSLSTSFNFNPRTVDTKTQNHINHMKGQRTEMMEGLKKRGSGSKARDEKATETVYGIRPSGSKKQLTESLLKQHTRIKKYSKLKHDNGDFITIQDSAATSKSPYQTQM